jgi:transposase
MRVTRKVYTEEFRQDAVRLLKTTDRPFKKVAEDLGVSEFTLRQWYKQAVVPKKSRKQRKAEAAKFHGEETPEHKLARLERENVALQKENDSLRMDREILKKAAAFFAKESE